MTANADQCDAAAPSERQLHPLAVALAALAGFVDASGFMQLGGTFVSFMSGNSTRLAAGVTRMGQASVLTALVIGAFLTGAFAGALLSTAVPIRRKPVVLLASALGLGLAALVQMAGSATPAVLVMALSMGCANNVFRSEDGPYSIGVTYMTGNLVKFAEGLAFAVTGRKRPWLPYALLWLGLIAGAMAGAYAFRAIGLNNLWFAAAAAALLAVSARNVRSPPIER